LSWFGLMDAKYVRKSANQINNVVIKLLKKQFHFMYYLRNGYCLMCDVILTNPPNYCFQAKIRINKSILMSYLLG